MGRVSACLKPRTALFWKAARDSRKKAPPIPALKGPAKIAYSDADKSPVANENPNGSNNSASQNTPQNQSHHSIMLFVEKNYKAQMAAQQKSIPQNKIPPNG
ncbi:hypothetical protein TNCV_3282551 [Trichonephila clavipes]|nr:hypothetical protein TNCV_3282551 [Trichonephila clavipes]